MIKFNDITKFLEDASEIRAFDLGTSEITDVRVRNMLTETIKEKVTRFLNKYPNLESPEREYLEGIKNFYGVGDKKKFEKLSLDTPLKQLFNEKKIKTRVYYGLHMADIDYFGELLNLGIDDFAKFRNLGKKSSEEIQKLVSEAGYSLGQDIGYVRPDKRK